MKRKKPYALGWTFFSRIVWQITIASLYSVQCDVVLLLPLSPFLLLLFSSSLSSFFLLVLPLSSSYLFFSPLPPPNPTPKGTPTTTTGTPTTAASPPPQPKPAPNVALRATQLSIHFEDDPFEARLARNFRLLQQEQAERDVRQQVLEDKLAVLEQAPAADWLQQVYESLARKNASIYCDRARKMHAAAGDDAPILHVEYNRPSLVLLSDKRLTGPGNVQRALRLLDDSGAFPSQGLDLSMALPTKVHLTIDRLRIGLRRVPVPLVETEQLTLHGTVLLVEPRALPSGVYTVPVYLSPTANVTLARGITPIKLYHAVHMHASRVALSFGQSLDAIVTHASMSVDLLDSPSMDPSPPLPWFDKARYLRHGDFDLQADVFEMNALRSADPEDDLDYLQGRLTDMRGWWRRSAFGLTGDGEWRIFTPSKFNRCPLHHWPGLALDVTLHWMCFGDGNNHHAVHQSAPAHVRGSYHDSYRGFRSARLEFDMDLRLGAAAVTDVTAPADGSNGSDGTQGGGVGERHAVDSAEDEEGREPCELFYANTLSWLRQLRDSFGRPMVPVRRGRLYARGGILRCCTTGSFSEATPPYMVKVSGVGREGEGKGTKGGSLITFTSLFLLFVFALSYTSLFLSNTNFFSSLPSLFPFLALPQSLSVISRTSFFHPTPTQGNIFKKPSFGEHLEEVRARLATPKLTIVYCNQYDGKEVLFMPLVDVDFRIRYNNTRMPLPEPPASVPHALLHRPMRAWNLSDGEARIGSMHMYALQGEDDIATSEEDGADSGETDPPLLPDDVGTPCKDSESASEELDLEEDASEALRRGRVIFDLPAYVAQAHRTERAFRTATASSNGRTCFGAFVEAVDGGFRAPDGALWYHFLSCEDWVYNGCPPAERELRHASHSPSSALEESKMSVTVAGLLPPPRRDRSCCVSGGSSSPTSQHSASVSMAGSTAPASRLESPLSSGADGGYNGGEGGGGASVLSVPPGSDEASADLSEGNTATTTVTEAASTDGSATTPSRAYNGPRGAPAWLRPTASTPRPVAAQHGQLMGVGIAAGDRAMPWRRLEHHQHHQPQQRNPNLNPNPIRGPATTPASGSFQQDNDDVFAVEAPSASEFCCSTSNAPSVLVEPSVQVSSEGHVYAHSVTVHNGRMAWSPEVRRVVRAMWSTYREQRQLRFELSTAALRPESSDNDDTSARCVGKL